MVVVVVVLACRLGGLSVSRNWRVSCALAVQRSNEVEREEIEKKVEEMVSKQTPARVARMKRSVECEALETRLSLILG